MASRLRRAISGAASSDARYGATDPTKVRGCVSAVAYRQALEASEPSLLQIRDLCDYAKHGPVLGRGTVTVAKTEQATRLELTALGYLMGTMHHEPAESLVVTLLDGSEKSVRHYLSAAQQFWDHEFTTQGL